MMIFARSVTAVVSFIALACALSGCHAYVLQGKVVRGEANDVQLVYPDDERLKAPGGDKQNLPPSAGMQFFGHVKIEGATGQMTVTLRDRADVALWSTTLDPKPV